MDDLVVLDLLDCPLCHGKLDVTAKVLPCQHTFCQPCLQRIFKARKELKCPECRTPVQCSIDELPANLLLVRILDGLKGGQTLLRRNSSRRMGGLFIKDSLKKNKANRASQDSTSRTISKAGMPVDGQSFFKPLTANRCNSPRDLTLSKGDIIVLHRQLDENWNNGQANRGSRISPETSGKVLQPAPALCKAIYKFDLKEKNRESKDCLKFQKDDVISVIRRMDENWAEGKLGDQVGIFPLMFVELNQTAKQLLESNKNNSHQNSTLPPLMKAPSKVKGTQVTANHTMPEGRRKGPRQFLITNALNRFNKMVHSPTGRQTPEISSPILISSSNSAIIEKAEGLSTSPVQVNNSLYYPTFGTQSNGTPLMALPSSHQTILANMCIVLHPYMANGPEEMNLQKGEGVRVLGKFQEGWHRGVSLVTGKIGLFPSYCVSPVYRKSPNYTDPRVSANSTKWISSSASVSSQGSMSENGLSRPFRPFVPTAVVEPMKQNMPSSSAAVTLRRNSKILRKCSTLQRNAQSNSTALPMTSTYRPSSATIQSQPIHIFYNASQSNVGTSAENCLRPQSAYNAVSFGGRTNDYRRYSTASYVFIETNESSAKSDSMAKSPLRGPPSILVKPDTPKSTTDKVKTVRFLNFSPPPLKRQGSQIQYSTRNEQLITEAPKAEGTAASETISNQQPRANPMLIKPTDNRGMYKLRSSSSDIVVPKSPISVASKRAPNDSMKRWSAVYYPQDILSS
ncbi:SH3 domain containing ring finger 2 S homeolog [Xenopus laevis]|uniref:RING-type E3 ubiquitin transferase n=1 Tax=Xenopus laevis TaxID=8355 RepID=Q6INQ3_XENLA|nr:SH3 domain containing ring finger 2 S homeolog [Xenopus laevis]AAH72221.1 MGC81405 protein [Xenopus laevis]